MEEIAPRKLTFKQQSVLSGCLQIEGPFNLLANTQQPLSKNDQNAFDLVKQKVRGEAMLPKHAPLAEPSPWPRLGQIRLQSCVRSQNEETSDCKPHHSHFPCSTANNGVQFCRWLLLEVLTHTAKVDPPILRT